LTPDLDMALQPLYEKIDLSSHQVLMRRLLIVEPTGLIQELIESRLGHVFAVNSATDIDAVLTEPNHKPYDLVLWDAESRPSRCSNVAHAIHKFLKHHRESRAIVLSDMSKPAMINGRNLRCDWLQKPVADDQIITTVENAICAEGPVSCNSWDNTELIVPVDFEGILAFNLKMRTVIQYIMEAAGQDIPVLITGETGTGKDLVAAAIHKRSKRNSLPFLAVNMGAIAPELVASELFGHEKGAYTGALERRAGFFEQAQGGTLFLDEITTMDEKTQVSLLRVLETQTIRRVRGENDINVNARIIAATNVNIEEAVRQGRFREDLFYRLDVFRIQLPPLRERHTAVTLLTDHFVALYSDLYKKDVRTVSRETYRLMRTYAWPGNIRELKNVIQRAVLLAKEAELTADLLPERIRDADRSGSSKGSEPNPIQLGMSLDEVEREYIKMALSSMNGNKVKAAALLKISRRTLYNKLKRFHLL
jgi:DNA-binding NtrC family response regulator